MPPTKCALESPKEAPSSSRPGSSVSYSMGTEYTSGKSNRGAEPVSPMNYADLLLCHPRSSSKRSKQYPFTMGNCCTATRVEERRPKACVTNRVGLWFFCCLPYLALEAPLLSLPNCDDDLLRLKLILTDPDPSLSPRVLRPASSGSSSSLAPPRSTASCVYFTLASVLVYKEASSNPLPKIATNLFFFLFF